MAEVVEMPEFHNRNVRFGYEIYHKSYQFISGFRSKSSSFSCSSRNPKRFKRNHRLHVHVQRLLSFESAGSCTCSECLLEFYVDTKKKARVTMEERIRRVQMSNAAIAIFIDDKKQLRFIYNKIVLELKSIRFFSSMKVVQTTNRKSRFIFLSKSVFRVCLVILYKLNKSSCWNINSNKR